MQTIFAQKELASMWTTEYSVEAKRLAEVVDGEMFVAAADVAGTVVRTTHRIDPVGDRRARVVYRLEALGPAAEAIGPAISGDFGDTLTALVEHVGR